MERWREARRKDSFARKKKFLLGLLLQAYTKSFQRKWTAPISKRKESLFAALQCKSVETGIARLIMRPAFTHDSTMGLSDFTWIDFDFSFGKDWIGSPSSKIKWSKFLYYIFHYMYLSIYLFFFLTVHQFARCSSDFYDRIKFIERSICKLEKWTKKAKIR